MGFLQIQPEYLKTKGLRKEYIGLPKYTGCLRSWTLSCQYRCKNNCHYWMLVYFDAGKTKPYSTDGILIECFRWHLRTKLNF